MEYLLLLMAVVLPQGLSQDDTVSLDSGAVEYLGAELAEEAAAGQPIELKLYFDVDEPLGDQVWNFLHIESQETDCRVVLDRRPTGYDAGLLVHTVSVTVQPSPACKPQRLEVYTGFYNRQDGRRFEVDDQASNRIHAAYFDLVETAPAQPELHTLAPSDMQNQRLLAALGPWWGWIGGAAGATVLAFVLGWLVRRRDAELEPDGVTETVSLRRWWVVVPLALLAVPAVASILAALDFVKDDAYISFRYAHNLVEGWGLVFNPGERLEGFTNFLWTLVLAPFEAMGLDLFQVAEILGTLLVLGIVAQLVWLSFHWMGGADDRPRLDGSHLWAGLWIATSSSLALWSTSGLEQPLAMLLPLASAYLLWTSWHDEANASRAGISGVLIGLGCMTRPEIHLIGILLGLPLVWRVIRTRRLDRITRLWFAGLLGITVPFHAFRVLYYGSLLPNTFYVKTGGSELVWLAGVRKLHQMFEFNHLGWLVLLAPLAFLDRKHWLEKLVASAIAVGFMAYVVKVGVDEMRWHRLYLPALPFLVLLAAAGLRNLCAAVVAVLRLAGHKRLVVYAVGWALVATAAWSNFDFTYDEMSGFNGRGDLSGNFHPDLGKFVTRHERPGGLVAFQDMGSTPYHAPDIDFLDFIGLVDGTVARARHSYGLHAFLPTGGSDAQASYDAEMRDYFYERSPEWVILTSYIPGSQAGRVSSAFARNPVPKVLEPWIGTNSYQFGIYDQKFKQNYAHVRTWPRSATYYLSLFRKRELWEQTPGEVVFEAPPEALGQAGEASVEASFEGGLELLGTRVEPEAIEKQEFFVTSWWRLPGPMRDDLHFFLHVERDGYRAPFDTIPGDFMYPADRWQEGQYLEHRVLFQVPPSMAPGTYEVYMGAYFRRDGRRLPIVQGPDDGQNRLHLGTVEVVGFRPYLDHIIEPTRLGEQRKHPERIVDHGRPRRD